MSPSIGLCLASSRSIDGKTLIFELAVLFDANIHPRPEAGIQIGNSYSVMPYMPLAHSGIDEKSPYCYSEKSMQYDSLKKHAV